MNTVKISKIIKMFSDFTAYLDDGKTMVDRIWNTNITGNSDNEILILGWSDDGLDYEINFNEEGLSNACIQNGRLVMRDIEGNEVEVTFVENRQHCLTPEELES